MANMEGQCKCFAGSGKTRFRAINAKHITLQCQSTSFYLSVITFAKLNLWHFTLQLNTFSLQLDTRF